MYFGRFCGLNLFLIKLTLICVYVCVCVCVCGGGGGVRLVNLSTPHCWFSLNNWESVKAVTLTFCSIQQLFIRDIRAKIGIANSPQSPYIGQNSHRGISDFRISQHKLIKLDKRNTSASKKLTMTSRRQIVRSLSFFLIYGYYHFYDLRYCCYFLVVVI